MKKILVTVLILFTALPAFSAEQVEEIYKDLQNLQQNFFQSSVVPMVPDVQVKKSATLDPNDDYYENDRDDAYQVVSEDRFVNHMPLFKKTREAIQKMLKAHGQKVDEREFQREQARLKAEEEKERQAIDSLDIKYLEYAGNSETQVSEKKKTKADKQVQNENNDQNQKVELVGGVKQHVTEKEMQLDCDQVIMNEESGDIEAHGNPVLTFPAHNIKLTADKMTYNRDSNILKAIDNVVLTKDGVQTFGDYMQVNMNDENIFIDNVKTETLSMKIVAKKAVSDEGQLTLHEGNMHSDNSHRLFLKTEMVGPDFSRMIVPEDERSSLFESLGRENDSPKLKIVAAEINVKADKEHDVYEIKDAEIYYRDKYLFTWPSFTAYTNKRREYFEANYPELGSQPQMGMFVGPGLVFGGPNGSIVKVMPLVNYYNKLGFGGAVKFKSAFNDTQIMYGSAQNNWIVRGRQELDENLYLQYGMNSYLDNWFMGSNMGKYNAELVYHKPTTIRNFLYKNADMKFTQRVALGYAQDGDWKVKYDRMKSSGVGTIRAKYMAEVDQTLFKRRNVEERKEISLNFLMQGSAAVYGTGDTQFVGRVGPRLHTQYKRWMQDIGYFATAISDHTPMPVYDMYRYGHSSLYVHEALRVCKYLSVGWAAYANLMNDAPNGRLLQENAFIVSLGPDDFKVNLGYDFMRESTYFTVMVAFDTKNTDIEFDKMVIKNPERLGQPKKQEEQSAFQQTATTASATTGKPVYQYAEVIDIEDPDKESI